MVYKSEKGLRNIESRSTLINGHGYKRAFNLRMQPFSEFHNYFEYFCVNCIGKNK